MRVRVSLVLFIFLQVFRMNAQEAEFVPAWAKNAIWYQIFPDRFYNGDKSNDPKITDLRGADPQEQPKQWRVHPWTSDWYELQDYEKKNGESELGKHLLRRRYGGDIQGIILKLDYLKALGVNALYINPLFDSPSLHKYDGASYHHIDPNFGPDPEGDRLMMSKENQLDPNTWVWTKADELALQLIEEAHKRGMHIIFDGVFNHMGINSFAFKDVQKHQQKSAYKDWFIIKSWEDPAAGTHFDYEGWWGVKSLPEFREDENGIVKGPKEYIFNATSRWMNPKGKGREYGIDGWRLDVAFCVGHPFWKEWRKHVRSLNPEAYMTAEIVDVPEKVVPYMQGDEFDGEMNYNFAFTCMEFFINPDSMRISASIFDKKLKQLRELYPPGVAYVSQNLFDSHDVNRVASHIVNRGIGNFRDWGKYYGISLAAKNKAYKVNAPTLDDIRLLKLLVIMQMTYVGAPMIYYGDEVGMWGANDPDCRKPMLWDEFTYTAESTNPDGSKRTPDPVHVRHDVLAWYTKMIEIRNMKPVFRTGAYTTLIADDKRDVFAFRRSDESDEAAVVFNNAQQEQTITVPVQKNMRYVDLISGRVYKSKGKKLKATVEAKWGAVLVPLYDLEKK